MVLREIKPDTFFILRNTQTRSRSTIFSRTKETMNE